MSQLVTLQLQKESVVNFFVKFLKAISSEDNPWQIALGIALGMIFGLSPFWRLHNLVILLLVLFFRINIASFLVAASIFAGLAYALDPFMVQIGEGVLAADSMQSLWVGLYNTPIGRLSQFNHTLTMGSLILSLVLAPIVILLSRYIIIQYRARIMERVKKLHIVRMLRASTFVQRLTGLGD